MSFAVMNGTNDTMGEGDVGKIAHTVSYRKPQTYRFGLKEAEGSMWPQELNNTCLSQPFTISINGLCSYNQLCFNLMTKCQNLRLGGEMQGYSTDSSWKSDQGSFFNPSSGLLKGKWLSEGEAARRRDRKPGWDGSFCVCKHSPEFGTVRFH